MFDWMTLIIELIGLAIFFVWIVIPIREFRVIFRRLRHKKAGGSDPAPVSLSKKGAEEVGAEP
jgi:hypothetical protein